MTASRLPVVGEDIQIEIGGRQYTFPITNLAHANDGFTTVKLALPKGLAREALKASLDNPEECALNTIG